VADLLCRTSAEDSSKRKKLKQVTLNWHRLRVRVNREYSLLNMLCESISLHLICRNTAELSSMNTRRYVTVLKEHLQRAIFWRVFKKKGKKLRKLRDF